MTFKDDKEDDKVDLMSTASSRDASSYSGDTTFTGRSSAFESVGDDGLPGKEIYVDPVVAPKEKKAVVWSKILVFVVLLLAVAVVATTACLLLLEGQENDFESAYYGYASEVVTVAQENANKAFEAIASFSVTVSSYAVDTNKTWPYVTIPHYATRARAIANMIGDDVGLLFVPIVQEDERQAWENYTRTNVAANFLGSLEDTPPWSEDDLPMYLNFASPVIFKYDVTKLPEYVPAYEDGPGPWPTGWQIHPLTPRGAASVNYNFNNGPRLANNFYTMSATLEPTIEFVVYDGKAESQIMQPIFRRPHSKDGEKEMVAYMLAIVDWIGYFQDVLTDGTDGVIVVLKSSCEGDAITYEINGANATFLGNSDLHDPTFDYLEVSASFVSFDYDKSKIPEDRCATELSLHLYPSETLKASFYETNEPITYTIVIVVIFLFTSLVFVLYDFFVGRHQEKVMARVIQQDKLVANVFPTAIRQRFYKEDTGPKKPSGYAGSVGIDPDDLDDPGIFGAGPLAEIYPAATIIFADVAGFTPWSSAREPHQVFMLLETLYSAFDKIAYRHGIFKVETVGDCYVGVAGIPEPREDHVVAACKFARQILARMRQLTRKLEVTLGPDTADLDLTVGIHSGQVLAGVLRGERARFQLFGDTVNTTSRMQSTSERNKIQVSITSAELLRREGLGRWIKPRDEGVTVKGKGKMQTYWLSIGKTKKKRKLASSEDKIPAIVEDLQDNLEEYQQDVEFGDDDFSDIDLDVEDTGMAKKERLVAYNVEVLCALMQRIVAAREERKAKKNGKIESLSAAEANVGTNGTVLDEFIPIIPLKRFAAEELEKRRDPASIDLGAAVRGQLTDYLTIIAGMYRKNPFHNFEHASHVTASVRKLLSRIVNVSASNGLRGPNNQDVDLTDLAGHSYGITSDPLTQFAVVLSAIIHDVDHPGVPNTQLVKENTRNAQIYKKSIAEQNSVDLAWDMLMQPEYKELRSCIYANEEELKRFRQLVVNTVMATDIADKELQSLRKERWNTAFSESAAAPGKDIESEDRKATIVIEHLIQASDVSHTMQHWHVYKKWNEMFFMEMYGAYKKGRAETDPSTGWYKGEIGFFDFYIIPLAKKLENCGVFGVSSLEYLNYALANREQWVRDGESIVQEYINKYDAMQEEGYSSTEEVGTDDELDDF